MNINIDIYGYKFKIQISDSKKTNYLLLKRWLMKGGDVLWMQIAPFNHLPHASKNREAKSFHEFLVMKNRVKLVNSAIGREFNC
jgi:hypothetical protein